MEEELESMIIRLIGDSSSLEKTMVMSQKSVDSAGEGIQKSLNEINGSIQKTTEGVEKAARDTAAFMTQMQFKLGPISSRIRLFGEDAEKAMTAMAVWDQMEQAFTGFAEAEGGLIRLTAAIAANGREVESAMTSYNAFAEQMQSLTVYDDDAVLGLLQRAESLGVVGDNAQRAAQNAIALAAANGGSAESFIRQTVALEQGNVAMLSRYLPGLRHITNETDRAAEAQRLLGNMFNVAQAEANSINGQFQQLSNSVGNLYEAFGEIIADFVKPFVAGFRELVNLLSSFDQETKQVIVGLASIVVLFFGLKPLIAVVGEYFGGFGKAAVSLLMMLNPLNLLTLAWNAYNAAVAVAKAITMTIFSPVGLMIAGITVAVLYLVEQLGGWENAWNLIKETFSSVLTYIKTGLSDLPGLFTDVANFISVVFVNLGKNIVDVFTNLPGLISGAVDWADVLTPLTQGFQSVLNIPEQGASAIAQQVAANAPPGALANNGKPLEALMGAASGSAEAMARVQAFRDSGGGAGQTPQQAANLALRGLAASANSLTSLFDGLRGFQIPSFSEIWNAIAGYGREAWDSILDFGRGVWDAIEPYATMAWDRIQSAALAVWNVIGPLATAAWNIARDLGIAFWNFVRDTAINVWNTITGVLTAVINGDWAQAGTLLWQFVENQAVIVWNGIRDTALAFWNNLPALLSAAWDLFIAGVTASWNVIRDTALAIWNAIPGIAQAAWDGIVAIARAGWDTIVGFATAAWNTVRSIFASVVAPFRTAIAHVVMAVGRVVSLVPGAGDIGQSIQNAAQGMINEAIAQQNQVTAQNIAAGQQAEQNFANAQNANLQPGAIPSLNNPGGMPTVQVQANGPLPLAPNTQLQQIANFLGQLVQMGQAGAGPLPAGINP